MGCRGRVRGAGRAKSGVNLNRRARWVGRGDGLGIMGGGPGAGVAKEALRCVVRAVRRECEGGIRVDLTHLGCFGGPVVDIVLDDAYRVDPDWRKNMYHTLESCPHTIDI